MNKIKKYISEIILAEISENKIENWHGIIKENITQYLVPPFLESYRDTFDRNVTHQFWTVLRERPEEKSGYTIFYDHNQQEFGLGVYDKSGQMISLEYCGSFIDTLNSM